MDFFQTIWTALTTENENLTNIIILPLVFIEITVAILVSTSILNIHYTKKQKNLYIIIMSFLGICSNLFIPNSFRMIISIVLTPILILFIFKTTILKSIFVGIIPFIITVILDSFNIKLFINIFNITYDQILYIPLYRIGIMLFMYLGIYLIYRFTKFIKINFDLIYSMDKHKKRDLIIRIILMIIAIITQYWLIDYYSDTAPTIICFLNTLSLLTYFIVSINNFIQSAELIATSQNLTEAISYNKTLKILHENLSTFQHDFGNIVTAIGGYAETNDIKGLKTYYSQLLADCQKTNNLTSLSPDLVNNPAIYNILATKYHAADEADIKINLEIFLNLNNLNIKIYEFTRILGILLDNAIEAASECDEKIINVIFRNDTNRNRQLIIIENTYKNKNIDTEKIYEKGITSKNDSGKSHGLGLWKVRQILSKNTNLNLFTSKDEKFFKQQLEIYIN